MKSIKGSWKYSYVNFNAKSLTFIWKFSVCDLDFKVTPRERELLLSKILLVSKLIKRSWYSYINLNANILTFIWKFQICDLYLKVISRGGDRAE